MDPAPTVGFPNFVNKRHWRVAERPMPSSIVKKASATKLSPTRQNNLQAKLYAAIEADDAKGMEALLAKGADPWVGTGAFRESAMAVAIAKSALSCLPALVAACGGMSFAPSDAERGGESALETAVKNSVNQSPAVVKALLACAEGQAAFTKEQKGRALGLAMEAGFRNNLARQCALEIARRAEPTKKQWEALAGFAIEEWDADMLAQASKRIDLKTTKIANGLAPAHSAEERCSPLTLAARRNNAEAARFLLSQGCDARDVDPDVGLTPLMEALRQLVSGEELLSALLPASDIHKKTSEGLSALDVAVAVGNHHAAGELLRAGASAKTKNKDGSTPLMLAMKRKQANLVRVLASVSDLSARDNDGKTAVEHGLASNAWACVDAVSEFLPFEEARKIVFTLAAQMLPQTVRRAEADILQEAVEAGACVAAASTASAENRGAGAPGEKTAPKPARRARSL